MATSKLQALWNHPAGPKTIHFWAPTFKWGISIANIADFAKPAEKISLPQQIGIGSCLKHFYYDATTSKHPGVDAYGLPGAVTFTFTHPSFSLSPAVTATGLIWSRYSLVITPKNFNLFSVNVAMAGTGIYQLTRKIKYEYFSESTAEVAKE